jgi:hypothetical protein
MKKFVLAFFALAIVVGLGACKEEGAAEKAGKAVDEKAKEVTEKK